MNEVPWREIVPNGGRVFVGGGAMVPFALMQSLLEQREYFQDVEFIHIHTLGELPWLDKQYDGHFRTNSFFLSRTMSEAVNQGRADYTPCPTFEVPNLFRQGVLALDVALIQVSPPDADGYVSTGLSADVIFAAVHSATVVVAQINRKVPLTFGDTRLAVSDIDHFIEQDAELPQTEPWAYLPHHEKIGRYAAQLIDDGSTIQVSMGNSPQAVLRALDGHENLGIHTGCFTDTMMELVKNGVVDNSNKAYQRGISVASHCLGSQELYDFMHNNHAIELHKSEWANDPHRIGKHKQMVSINGAREIDLTGQVVRDSRGHHFYGGIGATQDFIRGAAMSEGGRPIIALSSLDSSGRSRIVTGLASGSGVCSSRGDVHYVVTEYGIANLVGQTIRQRVLRLVEIAHPDVRESLLEGARMQGWIPEIYGFNPRGIHDSGSAEIDSGRVKFSGITYTMRAMHPSDVRTLQQFFYAQDEETIRLRYGHAMPNLDEGAAYRMASVDQSSDLAIGVFYRDGHREVLRAVGRFYLDQSGESAEVAFLVHEKARRLGMANLLLSEIAKIAKKRGVKTFWASVQKRNEAMIQLFMNRGAERERQFGEDSDEFFMEVDQLVVQAEQWEKKQEAKRQASREGAGKDHHVDAPEVQSGRSVQNASVALWYSTEPLRHDTGDGHPESVERYQAILDLIEKKYADWPAIDDRFATVSEITMVHSPHYHDMVRMDVDNFAEQLRTGDTAICEHSYDAAVLSTGGVLNAVDEVMAGEVNKVFCATRPPGHHASEDLGMGFCVFNHVAVAARYAQQRYGLTRVAILDWDVHAGNGTQSIFYEDPSVLFFSSHQHGLFHAFGSKEERGAGEGEGTTINVPLPEKAGDRELLAAWGEPLAAALDEFQPDMIILSAGFDAVDGDPLADLCVTPEGFGQLTKIVVAYAEKFCDGRLISVLEGGYDPLLLADCVEAHLDAM
ncbi:GNAT family N-acetyltransferase [Rubritalea marina]|uniref:GNAT family N-acetyltransferase n=1 Tax=Rubritalea marina TaxID=361055 RepID=UPI00036B87C3|nr:GNAT family N-acetyltransferase [Rubritalea marina]